jgi:excinuclease ABC subunit C
VRDGRVRGQRGWVVEKVEDLTTGDLVHHFCSQLYGGSEGEGDVPRELLVPALPDDAPALADWLSEHRGSRVSLRVPQRGDKRSLMETVARNAGESLQRHKLRRAGDLTTRSKALDEIAEALGMDTAPLRIECFDVSQIQGTDVVASMVVFEDGLPRKAEYRRFAVRGNPDGSGTDDLAAMSEVMRRRFARYKARPDADGPRDRPESDDEFPEPLAVPGQAGVGMAAGGPVVSAKLADAWTATDESGGSAAGGLDESGGLVVAGAGEPGGLVVAGAGESAAAGAGEPGELAAAGPDESGELAVDGLGESGDEPDEPVTAELPGIDPLTGRPRRFAYPPQLVVVDGGQPQVNAVAAVLSDLGITDVALCGLAKRLEEVWLPGDDFPVILPRTSEALYLLQRVRDEAHRFAITFHRQRRSKRMTASALDDVPGLGETRRKALLRHFGSLKRLAAATPEEITEVPGIGRRTAEALLTTLNPPTQDQPAAGPAEPQPGAIPPGGAGKSRAGANRPRPAPPNRADQDPNDQPTD